MKKFLLLGCVFIIFACTVGCGSTGGDSNVPSIVKIEDAKGEIEDEDTGVFPTSFTITFSAEMDIDTITKEGNVLIACGDASEPAVDAVLDSTKKVLTVTVEDSYKYQLLECEVTFTNSIKSLDGKAMVEKTYTFTNACAVSDDFNAVSGFDTTGSCWKIDNVEELLESYFTTWKTLLATSGWAAFDIESSSFNSSTEEFTISGDDHVFEMITKTADVSSDDGIISFEFKLSNIEGFDSSDVNDGSSGAFIMASNDLILPEVRLRENKRVCELNAPLQGKENSIDCTNQKEVRFVISMDTEKRTWITAKFILEDGTSTNFDTTGISVPSFADADEIKIGLLLSTKKGVNKADFDYIVFDGLSVEGQY